MYKIRVYCDLDWVTPGSMPGAFAVGQANNPQLGTVAGTGSSSSIAQTLRMQVTEQVLTTTALSAITQAQFNTAINQAATDLQTILGQTNSTNLTNLAQAQGWATGGT